MITPPRHIHLDPLGGVAGDMFMAAMVDAWPVLAETVRAAVAAVGVPGAETMAFQPVRRAGVAAKWLDFTLPADTAKAPYHYPDMRARIADSPLEPAVRAPALSILDLLAVAEAEVHGIDIARVHFHEVGDWDSLADIVAAGAILGHFPTTTWSLGALPLGGGRVTTAHGPLPVPAPATRLLLRDLAVVDDGVAGERVTPTGAAIVKYLASARGGILGQARAGPVGMGAGTRDMAAIANVLRVAAYNDPGVTGADDLVAALACEIDDMTGEELAAAADHLRACDGVLDVSLFAGTGKKGRPVTALRLLCRPEVAAATAAAVLDSTSTLGLRHRLERRWVLARDLALVGADGVQVKIAQRPNGTASAKAEADDLPAPTTPAGGPPPRPRARLSRNRRRRPSHEPGGGSRSPLGGGFARHRAKRGGGQRRCRQHDLGPCRGAHAGRVGGHGPRRLAGGAGGGDPARARPWRPFQLAFDLH